MQNCCVILGTYNFNSSIILVSIVVNIMRVNYSTNLCSIHWSIFCCLDIYFSSAINFRQLPRVLKSEEFSLSFERGY